MSSEEIDTVIFDYGGVVADDYCEPATTELSRLLGVDPAGIEPLISEASAHGAAYRIGNISTVQFWESVRRLAGTGPFSVDQAQLLWQRTYAPNIQMLALLAELKAQAAVFVAIFSNMDTKRLAYTKSLVDWVPYVHRFVSSCETHQLKPAPGAFEAALRACNRIHEPGRVLFVDDRSAHVVAAERMGLQGYHFKDAPRLADFLRGQRLRQRSD